MEILFNASFCAGWQEISLICHFSGWSECKAARLCYSLSVACFWVYCTSARVTCWLKIEWHSWRSCSMHHFVPVGKKLAWSAIFPADLHAQHHARTVQLLLLHAVFFYMIEWQCTFVDVSHEDVGEFRILFCYLFSLLCFSIGNVLLLEMLEIKHTWLLMKIWSRLRCASQRRWFAGSISALDLPARPFENITDILHDSFPPSNRKNLSTLRGLIDEYQRSTTQSLSSTIKTAHKREAKRWRNNKESSESSVSLCSS